MNPLRTLGVFAALACSVASVPAFVITDYPASVPVERLVADAERTLKANPDSVEAHYALARCHYIAFGRDFYGIDMGRSEGPADESLPWRMPVALAQARQAKAGEMAYEETGVPPGGGSRTSSGALRLAYVKYKAHLDEIEWKPEGEPPLWQSLEHAEVAWREMQVVRRREPDNALYRLSEASFIEQFLRWAAARKPTRLSAALRGLTLESAAAAYLQAFRLSGAHRETSIGGVWWELIYQEAASGVLRLGAQREKPNEQCASASADVEEVQASLEKLKREREERAKESKGQNEEVVMLVTPLVLSLTPVENLSALLAPGRTVDFDLAGYGVTQRWPWLSAQAGLLVWDPERRGIVASGRQLFGNFTFQLIWENGYAALAALDDDRDGELTADELKGIRLWFDTNGDGRSSPDEVHDLADYGIAGLAVQVAGRDGISPMNGRGVRFADGRVLPTWDWTTEPAKP